MTQGPETQVSPSGAGPVQNDELVAAFDGLSDQVQALRDQLSRVIVGQESIVESLLAAVLVQGHVLIVGVPGLAKTLLVRSLASAMDLHFKRIQFTPDMMPSDILGTELIQVDKDTGGRSMQFHPGPIFANLILADEINRTPPRTQAALLESMAERQVTAAGDTMPLEQPFVVVATQNPIEQEGTYPLPEAQLDRFMFSLWMDYPAKAQEIDIVARTPTIAHTDIEPVIDRDALIKAAAAIDQMPVTRHVIEYAVNLARATRPDDPTADEYVTKNVAWGAGPRAGQYLILAAKALAAMEGLPTPGCTHVRRSAFGVLRHRIVVSYAAIGHNITSGDCVRHVLEHVAEPSEAVAEQDND